MRPIIPLIHMLMCALTLYAQGVDRHDFDFTLDGTSRQGTFGATQDGFGWAAKNGNFARRQFVAWTDVLGWRCWSLETERGFMFEFVLMDTQAAFSTRFVFSREDLTQLVNEYFLKYAADAIDEEWGCNPETLGEPPVFFRPLSPWHTERMEQLQRIQ